MDFLFWSVSILVTPVSSLLLWFFLTKDHSETLESLGLPVSEQTNQQAGMGFPDLYRITAEEIQLLQGIYQRTRRYLVVNQAITIASLLFLLKQPDLDLHWALVGSVTIGLTGLVLLRAFLGDQHKMAGLLRVRILSVFQEVYLYLWLKSSTNYQYHHMLHTWRGLFLLMDWTPLDGFNKS